MYIHRKSLLLATLISSILLISVLLSSGIAGLAPGVATAATGNLVVNPGFEEDGTGSSK